MWHPPGVDLSLRTDGELATVRVLGAVAVGQTAALADYLRVARENGAVHALVDLSSCTAVPTSLLPLLAREAERFATSGGSLGLCGVGPQNPFLLDAVREGRFPHFRSLDEAVAAGRAARLPAEGAAGAERPG